MTQRVQGKQRPFASGFSIAGGILIIASSLVIWQMITPSGNFMAERIVGDGLTNIITSTPFIPLTGLASGSIVLLSGVMMYFRPKNKRIWGAMALIFSALSVLSLGGFLLGTGLGVIGGIMGIANRQVSH